MRTDARAAARHTVVPVGRTTGGGCGGGGVDARAGYRAGGRRDRAAAGRRDGPGHATATQLVAATQQQREQLQQQGSEIRRDGTVETRARCTGYIVRAYTSGGFERRAFLVFTAFTRFRQKSEK